MILGVAVAVPLASTLVLVAALGGAGMLFGSGHADGTPAATNPGTRAANVDAASAHKATLSAAAFSQVAASGDTVVAVGTQGAETPSFRVSADGGRTWTAAATRTMAGPMAGHQATAVAGGPGGWVALGPHATWTSPDGRTWTLVATHGITAPGQTLTGLTKASWGYIATGTSAGTGWVWTSTDGLTWHSHTAAQFGLRDDDDEQIFAMTSTGTDSSVAFLTGSAHEDGKTCAYVWLRTDKDATWRTVVVPQTHGGGWSFAGVTGDAGRFIAVRPGTARGLPDAVVYTSDNGIDWTFATTITGSGGFTPQQVTAGSGDTGRFVVTGQAAGGRAVAYTSTDNGATWTPGSGFGVVPEAQTS